MNFEGAIWAADCLVRLREFGAPPESALVRSPHAEVWFGSGNAYVENPGELWSGPGEQDGSSGVFSRTSKDRRTMKKRIRDVSNACEWMY